MKFILVTSMHVHVGLKSLKLKKEFTGYKYNTNRFVNCIGIYALGQTAQPSQARAVLSALGHISPYS